MEYVFTNNGCFDKDCNTSYEQTLEGFQVYLQYRYAISREGMVYDGNWAEDNYEGMGMLESMDGKYKYVGEFSAVAGPHIFAPRAQPHCLGRSSGFRKL